jgi:polyisoprenoid-binding protein YceI
MRIQFKTFLLVANLILAASFTSNAQTLKINPKLSSITILGTTNVHDYETKVTQFNAEVVLSGTNQVQSMVLSIPVKSIRSKEKLMDTKTYEAFNSETYPTISFKMTEVNSFQLTNTDVLVSVTGNLTMNGTTKKITLKPAGKVIKPGVYEFKGAMALKMTDFKMKPPTAMMGMMKVGDGITLKYSVVFEVQ